MRILEDRYTRERQSLKVALRFLELEARTRTIRMWTGLSDDRIRKLYKSYMARARRYIPRHRGKSPHQIAYFSRSARIQQETAWLASLFQLFIVLPAEPNAETGLGLPNITRGDLLCQAYEMYQRTISNAQITFEHAVFLATSLARGELIRLGECPECRSLIVTDRFPVREKRCHNCQRPTDY